MYNPAIGHLVEAVEMSTNDYNANPYLEIHILKNSKTSYQIGACCDLIDAYIQPRVKQNYSKTRNQKQAEFWLLSYRNTKSHLDVKQKWSIIVKVLYLDFSLKNSYKLFYKFFLAKSKL
jgi:hypothetical protein